MTEPADPMQDQRQAASQDAEKIFRHITANNPRQKFSETREVSRFADSPSAQVVDRWMKVAAVAGRACRHVSQSPSVVYGAGAIPGLVLCMSCLQTILADKQRREFDTYGGRECDCCGVHAKTGHEGLLNIESIIMFISLCPECGAAAKQE